MEPLQQIALVLPSLDGRILAGLRLGDPAFEGCWEFPGGKIRPGEPADKAAVRELREETGLWAMDVEPLVTFRHRYGDRALELHCFIARTWSGTVRADPARNWTWFAPSDLHRLPMPEANRRILSELGRE